MGAGVIGFELQDVANVGATPRVNGLVVVTHHHDVLVLGRKQLGDGVLRVVGVLILVHHEVAETILIRLEHIGVVFEQQIRIQQQIVEVERVGGLQALLQTLVYTGGNLRRRVVRLLFEHTGDDQFVFRG